MKDHINELAVTFIFISLTILILFACEKLEYERVVKLETGFVSDTTADSALVTGIIMDAGENGFIQHHGHYWSIIETPKNSFKDRTDFGATNERCEFKSILSNLLQNTKYYVQSYATDGVDTIYGNIISFDTKKAITKPIVTTDSVVSVTPTSIQCFGKILDNGGSEISAVGFCWGFNEDITHEHCLGYTSDTVKTGNYKSTIIGLIADTTYFIRSYASNEIGISYGSILTFRTKASEPIFGESIDIYNITESGASVSASIRDDGGLYVSARGFCWSTSKNPSIGSPVCSTVGSGIGTFSDTISMLDPNTTHYIRAYATNTISTFYSTQDSFTTLGNPPVAAFTVSQITITAGQSVQFTDKSINSPTSWNWNFGDGNTSTQQNPLHTYSIAGIYTITLTATNNFSSDTEIKPNYITVIKNYQLEYISGNNQTYTGGGMPFPMVFKIKNVTDNNHIANLEANGLLLTATADKGSLDNEFNNLNNYCGNGDNGCFGGYYYVEPNYGPEYNLYITINLMFNDQVLSTDTITAIIKTVTSNIPPTITSTPPTEIDEDVAYSYTLIATDPDINDILAYNANQKPAWLVFNSSTHVLSGTPANGDVGNHPVSLSVSDGKATVYDTFTITVHNVNDYPVITSSPISSAEVNTVYSYLITAVDIDADILSYSAIKQPSWLSFNPLTRTLSGTPALTDIGNHEVILRVSDGIVNVDQNFFINVYNRGTFIDDRDGKEYIWVKIGNQVWMAENLAYLPVVSPPLQGSNTDRYYYVLEYNDNSVSEAKATNYYVIYGALYNWPAAMASVASSNTNPSGVQGVCPSGWHLPSDVEWIELTDYLGGESIAGGKLKEIGYDHWPSPNTGADNSSGFTGRPGGSRYPYGFDYIGSRGVWWSTTESEPTGAWSFVLSCYYASASHEANVDNKQRGLSVRCIRD